MKTINDIRNEFIRLLQNKTFVTDKSGVKTIEITGASFIVDDPIIFGTDNQEYIMREIKWYLSQSLNVNDIPHPIPQIWKNVATPDGMINSNYGWAIFSKDNGSQYDNVLKELKANPESRRGQMIYTRPSMHTDYNRAGMSDFMCCSNTVHHIRNGKLISNIYFRSNDAVFGFKNDYAWMKYVHGKLATDLNIESGDIIWNSASLHIYERHFNFVESAFVNDIDYKINKLIETYLGNGTDAPLSSTGPDQTFLKQLENKEFLKHI